MADGQASTSTCAYVAVIVLWEAGGGWERCEYERMVVIEAGETGKTKDSWRLVQDRSRKGARKDRRRQA